MSEYGPLSGQKLGDKYLLGDLLGEGGFGVVYKAQHLHLRRQQAIKVLLERHFRTSAFRDRFLREAQIIATLDHPYIVHVDDFWVETSQAYLVMPFISGGTLQDHLQGLHKHHLKLEQVTTYLEYICVALDDAHKRNVAHLDLKPLNLLVHEDGRLLLTDFGLAHLMKQGIVEGGSSLGFGTPHYMAPEHIMGHPERLSDIFSLGVMLYQMLVGRLPFEGLTPEAVMIKNMTEWPLPPRAYRPELPQGVEDVLARALAKKPEQRFQTANELLTACKNALVTVKKPISPSRASNLIGSPLKKPHKTQLRLDIAQLTDVGREREHNEDNMAYVLPKDPQVMAMMGALFIVADGGISPHAGEVAAEIAVDTVSNAYYMDDNEDVATPLLQAIKRANTAIYERAAENMLRSGMGTTCVAAVLRGNMSYIANVGDSRAYLVRGNQIRQISQDHSWVAEQVRAGLLTEDQARTHAYRNVITRCLGTQPDVEVDVFGELLQEGDCLVLCTNGLYHLVSDNEIRRIVGQEVPQESVYHLVERANENGGTDNITAIVIRVLELGVEPPKAGF